jgi:prevent-host-death family protein
MATFRGAPAHKFAYLYMPSRTPRRGWLKREKLKAQRRKTMKKVALSEVKDDLSKYLRMAEKNGIVITRHGKPAGVLIGFADEDAWFDYRLENDPRFLKRIAAARKSLQSGHGVRLEEV